MGTEKQWWPLSEGSWRDLGAIRSVKPTAEAHVVFLISSNYPNRFNFKNQNGCFNLLQKFPNFACGSLGYYEHFSQLCRHPNPNRIRVKNPGSDSPFESLLKF
jgi:hypothetical protein